LWSVFIGGFVSDPAVANGVVYVGTDDGIRAFDATSGANLVNIPTGSTTLSPVIVDGAVYASTFDVSAGGTVSAYVLSSGDTTPPVVTVPAAITTNATSPTGAVVAYTVTASDPDDAVASLVCSPTSGATFPIGTTTVTCTASDTNGNTSGDSFAVTVNGAASQLTDLLAAVNGVGPDTSLADQVAVVQGQLAEGDVTDACQTLSAFIHHLSAQSGKSIPPADAATLIATAQRIKAVLGC